MLSLCIIHLVFFNCNAQSSLHTVFDRTMEIFSNNIASKSSLPLKVTIIGMLSLYATVVVAGKPAKVHEPNVSEIKSVEQIQSEPSRLDFSVTAQSIKSIPEAFDAKYRLYYKWLPIGYADYHFQSLGEQAAEVLELEDNDELSDIAPILLEEKLASLLLNQTQRKKPLYLFSLSTSMRFLFYSDKRRFNTLFFLDDSSVNSLAYYQSRTGSGDDYQELVTVDQKNSKVVADFHKADYELQLDRGQSIYDGLAVQFQLYMHLRKKAEQERILYSILEPYGLMERAFLFVENKKIELDFNDGKKELDTVIYEVEREQVKHKTLMYFARELGYLPVMLEHFTDGKRKFRAVLIEYTH